MPPLQYMKPRPAAPTNKTAERMKYINDFRKRKQAAIESSPEVQEAEGKDSDDSSDHEKSDDEMMHDIEAMVTSFPGELEAKAVEHEELVDDVVKELAIEAKDCTELEFEFKKVINVLVRSICSLKNAYDPLETLLNIQRIVNNMNKSEDLRVLPDFQRINLNQSGFNELQQHEGFLKFLNLLGYVSTGKDCLMCTQRLQREILDEVLRLFNETYRKEEKQKSGKKDGNK